MSKTELEYPSNEVYSLLSDHFYVVEQLEEFFDIKYAWENGGFDTNEKGTSTIINPNTIEYNGVIYTSPAKLRFTYDDSRFDAGTYTNPRVVVVKEN